MAHAHKFSQWVDLCNEEPGLSKREQARRIGVNEATIRRWSKGDYPSDAPKAALVKVQGASRRYREERQADSERMRAETQAAISRDDLPESVAKLFAHVEQNLVPHAIALPMHVLADLGKARAKIEQLEDTKDSISAHIHWIKAAMDVYEGLRKAGLPDVLAARVKHWIESDTPESEMDERRRHHENIALQMGEKDRE